MSEDDKRPVRDAALARARACLDAYGADPARWPEADRALFVRYKDDYRFAAAREDAALVDGLLGAAGEARAREALRARLLAAAPRRRRGWGPALRGVLSGAAFAPPAFVRAGALMGVAATAFAAGLATADVGGAASAKAGVEVAVADAFGSDALTETTP